MGNVWFTSDLHFGHRRVAEIRGYTDVLEHDKVLVDNWRSQVDPKDQVWVLGDIAVSSPTYALVVLGQLPGEKHLIAGNHDAVHPMHRDAHKKVQAFSAVFASVQPYARRKVAGQNVLLSHFPYSTDHTEEVRYPQYRLPNLGEFLMHGHTHSDLRYTSRREFHVGVDAWDMKLVPLAEVQRFVEGRLECEARAAEYRNSLGISA